MAPQTAQSQEERPRTMAPPRLQKHAIDSLPSNQTLKYVTSTWVGIIFHHVRDISEMKEETSFLWIKAHPHVTVRTLKYMYYARHPLEDFALKHIDYYPDEDDQVEDLCARSPFAGSNVIVMRVVEEAAADEIDRLDVEEALRAKKLGKDDYFYHARHVGGARVDTGVTDLIEVEHVYPQHTQHNKLEVQTEPKDCPNQIKLDDAPNEHKVVAKKFPDFALPNANPYEESVHIKGTKDSNLCITQDNQIIATNAGNTPAVWIHDHHSRSQSAQPDGSEAATDAATEVSMIEELCVSVTPEPNYSQADMQRETVVPPFTPSVWKLLQDRLETLPEEAREALMTSPYWLCATPMCGKTLVLQPWTQFDHLHKPMCSECSDTFMQVEMARGLISDNTWTMYKRLMSHQLAIKQQRARWGQQVNLSDDAPADHAHPLPDLTKHLDTTFRTADLFGKNDGQEKARRPEVQVEAQATDSTSHTSDRSQRIERIHEEPQFGSPPRSLMVAPSAMLTDPMDTTSDSFFESAKSASDFLRPAVWTPQNLPQRSDHHDDTINPSQLSQAPSCNASLAAQDDTSFRAPKQSTEPGPIRRGFTNFARPGIVKNKPLSHIAPPPAPRQSTKRRLPDVEDSIAAELAELGGHADIDLGPRELRQRRQSHLRYNKNATQSDDDFVADDDEDEDDIYSFNHQSSPPKAKRSNGLMISLKPRNASTSRVNRKTKDRAQQQKHGFDDSDEEYAAIHEPIHVDAEEDDDGEWTPDE